jgi:chloramphenicol-sensitive protein RarD
VGEEAQSREARAGFIYGLIAYTTWGVIPLYFAQISHVRPEEILAHRIVWSLGIMALLTAITHSWDQLRRVLMSGRLMMTMTLSAILLAGNWLLYIYATVNNRVSEASLGYYMMPLVNAFLGSVFLNEKLRPMHYPALALVAMGVAIPAVSKGEFTWLAVALPITFGFYGLVRKKAPVESLTGLSVETLILTVPSVAFLLFLNAKGGGAFGSNAHDTSWLMIGGIATVLPLLTYTLSIRRLPLIAVSFIQFLSPTIQLFLAAVVLKETIVWERWAAVGCVLVAVAIFLADAVIFVREKKRIARRTMPVPTLAVSAS